MKILVLCIWFGFSEDPHLQLVLAGSGASDDPEIREVEKAAANDPAIRVLLLPPTSHKIINALQRGAAIVLQKSLKEGFGLTVAEALWKSKPVIGGNCGGIRLQIVDHRSGLLVQSVAETAKGISFLLQYPEKAAEYGENGRELVKERFLISRLLRDDLSILQNLTKRPL
jgi:trehalose synthase